MQGRGFMAAPPGFRATGPSFVRVALSPLACRLRLVGHHRSAFVTSESTEDDRPLVKPICEPPMNAFVTRESTEDDRAPSLEDEVEGAAGPSNDLNHRVSS
jgi:hypothetical protein